MPRFFLDEDMKRHGMEVSFDLKVYKDCTQDILKSIPDDFNESPCTVFKKTLQEIHHLQVFLLCWQKMIKTNQIRGYFRCQILLWSWSVYSCYVSGTFPFKFLRRRPALRSPCRWSRYRTMKKADGFSGCYQILWRWPVFFHGNLRETSKPKVNSPLIRPYIFLGEWHWGRVRFPWFLESIFLMVCDN